MLLHADADAFFASVEQRDAPQLAGRPFVVGDQVVACASYGARAAGIHAGMPLGRVRRQWPDVAVVPARAEAYEEASAGLFAIFRGVTPLVEPGSAEEAFLDVSEHAQDAASAAGVAARLRARCRAELGLAVSVGVGRTRLMAKLASRRAKPDGLAVIAPADEAGVRAALRLEDVWGVGPRTRERLHEAGLHSLAAIADVAPVELERLLGRTMGRLVSDIAHGRDGCTVRLPRAPQSVSRTRTISPPTRARSRVEGVLAECIERLADRLADESRRTTRLEVLLRYDDGAAVTARAPLEAEGPPSAAALGSEAARLLAGTAFEDDGRGVALIGAAARLSRSGR